jgi:hypothetical protein
MNTSLVKPLCLVVGDDPHRKELLSEGLSAFVEVVWQTAPESRELAGVLGPQMAVVLWDVDAKELAHQLALENPGLKIIVESNPKAVQGQIAKNGFSAVVDFDCCTKKIIDEVKALCLASVGQETSRPARTLNIAGVFSQYLPAIQASLENEQKLCEGLLNALQQATRAQRGGVFYASRSEAPFRPIATHRLSQKIRSVDVPSSSEIAAELEFQETILQVSDDDIPPVVATFLKRIDCNLLIPLRAESLLLGWIALEIPSARIDFGVVQSIAFFSSESLRVSREFKHRAGNEACWQAAFDQAFAAVAVVSRSGFLEILLNRKQELSFREPNPTTYQSFSSGRLRQAIRSCLEGTADVVACTSKSRPDLFTSVQRLPEGGAIVLVQSGGGHHEDTTISLDPGVWDHLVEAARLELGTTIGSGDDQASGQTFEEMAQIALGHKNVRLIGTQPQGMALSVAQEGATTLFLESILTSGGNSPITVRFRQSATSIVLEVTSEYDASAGGRAVPVKLSRSLSLALVLLIGAGVGAKKQRASLGVKWTLTFPSKPTSGAAPERQSVSQREAAACRFGLPEAFACATAEPSDEHNQGVSAAGPHQRGNAGKPRASCRETR